MKEIKIKIILRNELKIGDEVLFSEYIVKVKKINNDSWTFENKIIGKLNMPLYHAYYKVIKK